MPSRSTLGTLLALASLLALTAALYAPGLHGPFLVDDQSTLAIVGQWLRGQVALDEVLFGNTSFLTHRSLAMGSFALTAWLWGTDPFSFKLGNLILHLLCTLLVWALCRTLARRDARLSARASLIALGIATVWALHPLFVSTVLYAVQRMAQLAALACLAGMWLYAGLRTRMLAGTLALWRGSLLLLVGIGTLTLIGIQGKQNAAILPLLCLAIELAWFQRLRDWPAGIRLFFLLGVAVPVAGLAAGLVLRWEALQISYMDYGFTLGERLLSFARVLFEYMRMTFLPYTPAMGVFTDDYPVSTHLWMPWTTIPAWAGLLAISLLAWRTRRTSPTLFGGWCIFLAGHLIEGTLPPLELYYEHRNYLPAVGLLLAAASLVHAAAQWLARKGVRTGRIAGVAMVALVAMLLFQTLGRVRIWQDDFTIASSSIEAHPASIRATATYVNTAMSLDRPDLAYAALDRMKIGANEHNRTLAMLYRIVLDCRTKRSASRADLDKAVARLPRDIILNTPYVFAYLGATQQQFGCGEVTAEVIGDAITTVLRRATRQPAGNTSIWGMHHIAAQNYLFAGKLDKALIQARLAWQPEVEPAAAQVLVTALLRLQRIDEAEKVYRQAHDRQRGPRDRAALMQMRQAIESSGWQGGKPNLGFRQPMIPPEESRRFGHDPSPQGPPR